MFNRIIKTNEDFSALALRVILGLVIFPHGAQKLLGWFGGPGFDGIMSFFTQQLGIPSPLALLVIAIEFFGAIALIIGLFGRVAALGVAAVMLGATLLVHLPNGFFMNWFGNQPGEGFEFHLLALAVAVAVLIKGSGAFSLDRKLAQA